jgi:iron complex transport system ATP-binding protein
MPELAPVIRIWRLSINPPPPAWYCAVARQPAASPAPGPGCWLAAPLHGTLGRRLVSSWLWAARIALQGLGACDHPQLLPQASSEPPIAQQPLHLPLLPERFAQAAAGEQLLAQQGQHRLLERLQLPWPQAPAVGQSLRGPAGCRAGPSCSQLQLRPVPGKPTVVRVPPRRFTGMFRDAPRPAQGDRAEPVLAEVEPHGTEAAGAAEAEAHGSKCMAGRRGSEPRPGLGEDGPMTCAAYLELQDVDLWLGPRLVFEGLSLSLRRGEHTVVLGPNGSGKSSLVRLLNRELYPVVKRGSWLKIFGSTTVNLWELRRRIGLVSSDLQRLYPPQVRAADVVLSGLFGSIGIGRSQQATAAQRQRVAALLERLQLAALADRPFGQLSEGQQRRLLLARALVHDPEVLVLDEPTNGLDLRARHQLLASLRELVAGGTTLLLVTHQIEAIIPEVSRVLLLQQGKLVGDGAADELLAAGPLSALYDTPLRLVEAEGWRQVLPG